MKGYFYFWIWARNSVLGYMPCSSQYFCKVTPLLNLVNGVHIVMPSARDASKMYNALSVSWHWNVCSKESAKLCSWCNLHTKKNVFVLTLVCANMYLRAQMPSCIPIQHCSKNCVSCDLPCRLCLFLRIFCGHLIYGFYTYQVKNHFGSLSG